MTNVEFEFEDIPEKSEEKHMQKQAADNLEEEEEEEQEEEEEEEQKKEKKEQSNNAQPTSLGDIIAVSWNMIATKRGYEAVTPDEQMHLSEGLEPLEEKYHIKLSPELEAVATGLVVFAPKVMAKKDKDKANKTGSMSAK